MICIDYVPDSCNHLFKFDNSRKVNKYVRDLKYLQQFKRLTTSKQTNPLNSYLILFMFAKTYWK